MKRTTHPTALALCLILLAPSFAGCFELKQGDTKTADDVIKTEPKVVPRGAFTSKMALDGTKLAVSVRQSCALVEMEEVKHTTKTSNKLENGVSGGLIALGVLGSIPLTAGVVMLADAPKVFDSNRDSKTFNSTGKGAAIALGSVLAGIGTIAVTIPIVTAARVAGGDSSSSTSERQGKVIRPLVGCDSIQTATGVPVTAQAPNGAATTLGTTDTDGNLSADLKFALAGWFTGATPPPVSASIYVNGQFVGEVPVADIAQKIFDERDQASELMWGQAGASSCEHERTEPACARIRGYLTNFPTGRRANEAQKLIGLMTPQQPVVAVDPTAEILTRAIAAAHAATNVAANKVRTEAEKDHQKALLKSEEDAVKAGKAACLATCSRVCEDARQSVGKGGLKDAAPRCKTTCSEEACQ